MDLEARNKFCGYILFNPSKGPGGSNDLILNNYDASSFSNCDSDLYPSTGSTNHSMAAGAAAVDNQNVQKEENPFQIYDPSNNGNDNGKKLPGSSKMQPEKRPPRPPNAFILYRRAKQPAILAAHRNLTNAEISRYISTCWKNETDEERLVWERYADQKKLEHMQAYPNYVYKPNKNKGKNEKRRQARKQSAAATFASQDTTTTGETGPMRTKKTTNKSRLNNLVGKIEIPMVNKVAGLQNMINSIPMMTPPLSSPNTPILISNNNNVNNNNNNNNYTMPSNFTDYALTAQDLQLQQIRMQDALFNNDLANLSFQDLTPASFHEETVDPSLIFSNQPADGFYPSHNSPFDSTASDSSDLSQKVSTTSCNYPEFRDNSMNTQGYANMFAGLQQYFEPTYLQ